ncbi:MAG TPA: GspMb/PilO family protein [Candidatus Omnitrophota bacterium]|nr:GspMb/PilO family protein [Candidatus Omnitrophota bacterium]HPS36731.1 GspMb/PilO family protein [Candidatus Omnitrophota bacterium]
MIELKIRERQKEIAIKVGAAVLTAVVAYVLLIHPIFQEVRVLNENLQSAQERLDLFSEIEILKGDLASLEKSLLTLADRSVILAKMSDLASKAGLDVQTIGPRTEPIGEYVRLKIEIDSRARFFSVVKFLKSLREADIFFAINNLSLNRQSSDSPQGQESLLNARFGLETLLKQRAKKKNTK